MCTRDRDTIDIPTTKYQFLLQNIFWNLLKPILFQLILSYHIAKFKNQMNKLFATYSPGQPHKIITITESKNNEQSRYFKDEQPLYYLFSWATSLVLMFIVSNQSTAFQRMSNHYVYYSLWATTYFSLKFFSKLEMC